MRADTVHEHFCCVVDPFVNNKALLIPENKLHDWIFYKALHENERIMF